MIMRVIGCVTMKKRSSKFDNIRAPVKGRPHRRDRVFEVLVFGRQQMSGRTRIAFDWDVVSLPYTPVCKYRGRAGPWRRELRRIGQVSEQHQRNDGTDRTFYYLLTPPQRIGSYCVN